MNKYSFEISNETIIISVRDINKKVFIFKQRHKVEDYLELVDYILDTFLKDPIEEILLNEIFYRCWKLKLIEKENHYELHQFSHINKGKLSYGVDNAISLFKFQQQITSSTKEEFNPISLEDYVLISEKMLENTDLNNLFAWRFKENQGYSGWVFAENNFDFKETDQLKKIHLFHLFDSIIEILPFLTLPSGYELFKEGNTWLYRKNNSLID